MFPRSLVICSAHRVTDARTDGKSMDQTTLLFFCFWRKVVDGKSLTELQTRALL